MNELSVDDIFRVVDGMKERGVMAFRCKGLEVTFTPAQFEAPVDERPREEEIDREAIAERDLYWSQG